MAKLRQLFIWDGIRDSGPFRRGELVEQLGIGAVLPSHFYFEEGMSDERLDPSRNLTVLCSLFGIGCSEGDARQNGD
jgi:hypothetical protein